MNARMTLGLTVLLAVGLALFAVRVPRPLPASSAPTAFSAERAMADVREIARAPHPTGSARNAEVVDFLSNRLRSLGLDVRVVVGGPLSPQAQRRLSRWTGIDAGQVRPRVIVATLAGRDRTKPAVALMAHHDSVAGSPGAADDAAGVASALEVVRAIKARGVAQRDLVVLLTDAEELNLDGAQAVFGGPLDDRLGVVLNMEARGGGGRASMFETGADSGALAATYARAVRDPAGESFAAFVYDHMPNGTDLTLAKRAGLAGLNFAFVGRPALYHSPLATPDRVQPGSIQHMGGQVLDVTRALVFSPDLPARAPAVTFGSVFGLFTLAYGTAAGWLVLIAALALVGVGIAGARRTQALRAADLGWGALNGLRFALEAGALLYLLNRVSGASGSELAYYDRLAALPLLGLGISCALIAKGLLFARDRKRLSWTGLAVLIVGAALAWLSGGTTPTVAGLAFVALALVSAVLPRRTGGAHGGLGLLVLLSVLAAGLQLAAPTTSYVIAWPLLLGTVSAAVHGWSAPERPAARWTAALLAAVGLGWLGGLCWGLILGIGADLPAALAPFALIGLALIWPVLQPAGGRRLGPMAAGLLIVALGTMLWVRLDPVAKSVPGYASSPAKGRPGH